MSKPAGGKWQAKSQPYGGVAWEGLARLFIYSRHQERDARLWVLLGQRLGSLPLVAVGTGKR